VVFDNMVFDTTNAVDSEYFGLAWQAVPEPGGTALLLGGILLVLAKRRR
jgi:hypothetical protein